VGKGGATESLIRQGREGQGPLGGETRNGVEPTNGGNLEMKGRTNKPPPGDVAGARIPGTPGKWVLPSMELLSGYRALCPGGRPQEPGDCRGFVQLPHVVAAVDEFL